MRRSWEGIIIRLGCLERLEFLLLPLGEVDFSCGLAVGPVVADEFLFWFVHDAEPESAIVGSAAVLYL